jgi:serine/threonine-protein kinase SRPK3
MLRTNSDKHPGASYTMMLRDHFTIQGPNGKHDCLSFQVLRPSIARVRGDSTGADTMAYLTLPAARNAIYQVLLGLYYLHSLGLVHGDVYPGNVLFTVRELSHESPDLLRQPQSQVSADVKRANGGSWQPGDHRHLTLNWPLNQFISPKGDFRLSDLGNSKLRPR